MILFRERLSDRVHATTPKGIAGGFEFTVFQRNLKEWMLKESNKSRFDSYSVRNSVLNISHITFRDCRVHIFSNNLSRNSCIRLEPPWRTPVFTHYSIEFSVLRQWLAHPHFPVYLFILLLLLCPLINSNFSRNPSVLQMTL